MLSTAETEYMSLASTGQEAIWMRRLINNIISDTDNKLAKATKIYEDNLAANKYIKEPSISWSCQAY